MPSFSQRIGLKPVSEVIQTTSMNEELRNSLWNWVQIIWAPRIPGTRPNGMEIISFGGYLWANYLKKPIDDMPQHPDSVVDEIRKYFFSLEWNDVYEFVEFTLTYHHSERDEKIEFLNHILEREMSAYRIIDDNFIQISDEQERDMLESALSNNDFPVVREHLKQAFSLLSNREPDYRNSIKESISAVESMARILTDNPKATLGDALKVMKKDGALHPALLDGYGKIYGYTNDGDGIRHSMMELPNLNQDDAKYFLLTCTSFVNYLKATHGRSSES